jgi:hypothetical protein
VKLLILSFLFFSLQAHACWRLSGVLSVNQEKLEINQKVDHDKSYSFSKGNFIFHLKMPSKFPLPEELKDKHDRYMVELQVQEKQGTKIVEVTNTKILVKKDLDSNMVSSDGKSVIDLQIKIEDI